MLNIIPDSQQYIEDLHYDGEGDEFYDKYENKWIAIVNKQVVAYGNDPLKVKKKAAQKTGKSYNEIPIKFIESAGAIL